jgi:hypothetical protein
VAIREYLGGEKFDPETIRAMSLALEVVCAGLKIEDQNNAAKQAIVKKIIEVARQGEREVERVAERVLAALRAEGAY